MSLAALVVGMTVVVNIMVAVIRTRATPSTRRQLVVGELAAIPKAPKPGFAKGINERSPRWVSDKDSAWPNWCNGLLPIILWYGVLARLRIDARASTAIGMRTCEGVGTPS